MDQAYLLPLHVYIQLHDVYKPSRRAAYFFNDDNSIQIQDGMDSRVWQPHDILLELLPLAKTIASVLSAGDNIGTSRYADIIVKDTIHEICKHFGLAVRMPADQYWVFVRSTLLKLWWCYGFSGIVQTFKFDTEPDSELLRIIHEAGNAVGCSVPVTGDMANYGILLTTVVKQIDVFHKTYNDPRYKA